MKTLADEITDAADRFRLRELPLKTATAIYLALRGMSQRELARRLGLEPSYLSRILKDPNSRAHEVWQYIEGDRNA